MAVTASGETSRGPAAALAVFRGLLDELALECGAPDRRPALRTALAVLFSGSGGAWAGVNQKFDASVVFGRPGVRFSVNDFGERGPFRRKIRRAFALFRGGYAANALDALLDDPRPETAPYQTTFGLEWLPGAAAPRLKVYFEELLSCAPDARLALLRRASAAAGPEGGESAADDLAALGVDFLPGGGLSLKTYRYRARASARAAGGAAEEFRAALSREPRCFYYETARYGRARRPESSKLYKVYESRRAADRGLALCEIEDWAVRAGFPQEAARVRRWRRAATVAGAELYPVLCALDAARAGEVLRSAYFSLQ